MFKPIQEVSWKDLIGTWRGTLNERDLYDLTIIENGTYLLYNYLTKERFQGKINSYYLPITNTVQIDLENCLQIEFYQIVGEEIILIVKNEKIFFTRL